MHERRFDAKLRRKTTSAILSDAHRRFAMHLMKYEARAGPRRVVARHPAGCARDTQTNLKKIAQGDNFEEIANRTEARAMGKW